MKTTRALAAVAVLALAVAACAGAGPTPQPSESKRPCDAPASEAPAGVVVAISAFDGAYEQAEVSTPADASFVIRFENRDCSKPHNVEIKDAAEMTMFEGETFNGVATRDYAVDPLPAGTYQFVCTVHAWMVGTLKVEG